MSPDPYLMANTVPVKAAPPHVYHPSVLMAEPQGVLLSTGLVVEPT